MELVNRRALGTEVALVDRRADVTLDVDDLAVDRVHDRIAPDRAVRANARIRLRFADTKLSAPRGGRAQIDPKAEQTAEDRAGGRRGRATEQRPPGKHDTVHRLPPPFPLSAGHEKTTELAPQDVCHAVGFAADEPACWLPLGRSVLVWTDFSLIFGRSPPKSADFACRGTPL